MIYRKAEPADIPALVELRKCQMLDEGHSPISRIDDELAEYFASALADGTLVVWVAAEEAEIVATGGVCFYRLPPTYMNPTGRIAYVTNMFTVKAYRRRGLASALLRLVLEEAKSKGYILVRLHASSDGRPVYMKAGFTDADGYMSLRIQTDSE